MFAVQAGPRLTIMKALFLLALNLQLAFALSPFNKTFVNSLIRSSEANCWIFLGDSDQIHETFSYLDPDLLEEKFVATFSSEKVEEFQTSSDAFISDIDCRVLVHDMSKNHDFNEANLDAFHEKMLFQRLVWYLWEDSEFLTKIPLRLNSNVRELRVMNHFQILQSILKNITFSGEIPGS